MTEPQNRDFKRLKNLKAKAEL